LESEILTESEQALQCVANINQKINSLLNSSSKLKSAISTEAELEFRKFD